MPVRRMVLSMFLAATAAYGRPLAATLVVSPTPALASQPLHVSGCGYTPGLWVYGEDQGPSGVEPWGGPVDSAGCLAVDRKASATPGLHTLRASQRLRRNGSLALLAQVSFLVNPSPLAVTSESTVFQWDAQKACIGEDDRSDWTASGYLDPGASFVFTPKFPQCNNQRAVMVKLVSSDPTAQLEVSTVVPAADGISNNPAQAGSTLTVPTRNGVAQLCMFPNSVFTTANYAITVRNTGSARVSSVAVTGKDRNDWGALYWQDCLAADADRDGWSDSYEHAMAQLLYPSGNYLYGEKPAGSDYLRSCGTGASNDEFDAWPLDLDDDGAVTAADLAQVNAHLGQGNGVSWDRISPNAGPENFWNHLGDWNRFDLNGDGWVTSADASLVSQSLGAVCH